MFQFPTFASRFTGWYSFTVPGCPIRIFRDRRLFAPTPDFSQLITSFIASLSQGIHHSLLFAFFIFFCSCVDIHPKLYNWCISFARLSWFVHLTIYRPKLTYVFFTLSYNMSKIVWPHFIPLKGEICWAAFRKTERNGAWMIIYNLMSIIQKILLVLIG